MACLSLFFIVSRYLPSLTFGLLVFTCIAHSVPPPPGQSIVPAAIDYNVTSEKYSLVSRVQGVRQDWFTTQKFQNVWTGKVSCKNVHPNGLQSFARGIAKNAYDSMLVDVDIGGGKVNNLITTLCIPGQYCWVASIPGRWYLADQWVAEMMRSVPQWLEAYGPQYDDSEYHSEDLALALAADDGVRYPYSVEIDGVSLKAILRVYGLYNLKAGSSPAEDQIGPAGDRWPCVIAAPDLNQRTKPCTSVLTKLGIDFLYSPS